MNDTPLPNTRRAQNFTIELRNQVIGSLKCMADCWVIGSTYDAEQEMTSWFSGLAFFIAFSDYKAAHAQRTGGDEARMLVGRSVS